MTSHIIVFINLLNILMAKMAVILSDWLRRMRETYMVRYLLLHHNLLFILDGIFGGENLVSCLIG